MAMAGFHLNQESVLTRATSIFRSLITFMVEVRKDIKAWQHPLIMVRPILLFFPIRETDVKFLNSQKPLLMRFILISILITLLAMPSEAQISETSLLGYWLVEKVQVGARNMTPDAKWICFKSGRSFSYPLNF